MKNDLSVYVNMFKKIVIVFSFPMKIVVKERSRIEQLIESLDEYSNRLLHAIRSNGGFSIHDLVSKLKEIERFLMKEEWIDAVKRFYIGRESVEYSFKVKEDGDRISVNIPLELNFFISILTKLPMKRRDEKQHSNMDKMGRVDEKFTVSDEVLENELRLNFIPAALWIFISIDEEMLRHLRVPLDYVIPIIHMIWGEKGAEVKVVRCDGIEKKWFLKLVDDVIDDLLKKLGKSDIEVKRYGEPVFMVAITYPDLGSVEARELVFRNSKIFYGLAVSDEGYADVPQHHAEAQLRQWVFSTRRYETTIVSPVSIVLIKYDIDRYEHERFLIPRDELELWFKYYRYVDIYNLFPIEWITFLKAIYRALDEEIDFLRKRASTTPKPDTEAINELRRLKYLAILIEETLDARNIARIPESFGIFWRLLEYTGAKSLREYVALLVHEISDVLSSEYEELRHRHESTLNMLMLILSAAAMLDGVLTFIEMVCYENHQLGWFSLLVIALMVYLLYQLIRRGRTI